MARQRRCAWLIALLAAAPVFAWGAAVTRVPATLAGLSQTAVLGAHLALPNASLVAVPAPAALAAPAPIITPAAAPSSLPAAPSAESAAQESGRVFDLSVPIGADATVDASAASPSSLAGIVRRGADLYHGNRRLQFLGAGSFGRIFVHPRQEGTIIKMAQLDLGAVLSATGGEIQAARQDLEVGRRLAEAGVGPRVHGLTSVPGEASALKRWLWKLFGRTATAKPRPAVVKERVFGENVADLINSRRFTPESRELVHQMLGRMADARLRAWDLRTPNVMIGHTASDPTPRAYLIDGGRLMLVAEDETRDGLYRSLLRHETMTINVGGGGTANWGRDGVLEPFDDILQAGVARSRTR